MLLINNHNILESLSLSQNSVSFTEAIKLNNSGSLDFPALTHLTLELFAEASFINKANKLKILHFKSIRMSPSLQNFCDNSIEQFTVDSLSMSPANIEPTKQNIFMFGSKMTQLTKLEVNAEAFESKLQNFLAGIKSNNKLKILHINNICYNHFEDIDIKFSFSKLEEAVLSFSKEYREEDSSDMQEYNIGYRLFEDSYNLKTLKIIVWFGINTVLLLKNLKKLSLPCLKTFIIENIISESENHICYLLDEFEEFIQTKKDCLSKITIHYYAHFPLDFFIVDGFVKKWKKNNYKFKLFIRHETTTTKLIKYQRKHLC